MRPLRFVMPALLLTAAFSLAQTQPPPAPPAADPKLEQLLAGWEKAMTGIQSLAVSCNRVTLDKTYQTTEVFTGTAKFLKSGQAGHSSRASLELFKKDRPEIFEKYVCTGTFLYEFSPANKVIRIHELPQPKQGQVADDNFLSFLFGMKGADAKERYQLTYQAPPDKSGHYLYLLIQPRHAQDKADFSLARLVLWEKTHLPRQLWFRQPNGNEVTWDFDKLTTPADLRATEFAQPPLPKDWKWERVPAQNQPRVLRNNN